MKTKERCKLVNVKSEDQEEYADLIGQVGMLQVCSDSIIFHDLDIMVKGKPKEVGDTIIIKTWSGNTFTFRKMPKG